jgi:hypothetical protein
MSLSQRHGFIARKRAASRPFPASGGRACTFITSTCDNINYKMGSFMRNEQAGGRLPNSPANPLPTAFFGSKTARKSAAGRVGRIVYKLLIYNRYPTLRGRCYEAKKCFFAADRGMRRGQPRRSGQRRDTAGTVSAVRGSADSALRHRPWPGATSDRHPDPRREFFRPAAPRSRSAGRF